MACGEQLSVRFRADFCQPSGTLAGIDGRQGLTGLFAGGWLSFVIVKTP
jgi:hypothetical protein